MTAQTTDWLGPTTILAKQWDENGEHCVDWTEVPVPSRRVARAHLESSCDMDGPTFFIRRDDGLVLRVDDVGMSRGVALFLPAPARSRWESLSTSEFTKWVRRLNEDGELCHRIIDAYHTGNPFDATVVSRGRTVDP